MNEFDFDLHVCFYFLLLNALNESKRDLKTEILSETTFEMSSCTFVNSISSLNDTII